MIISGRQGVNRAGTLGAFVEDEKTKEVFVLSCDHVMRGTEVETEIVQPSLRDNVRALRRKVDDYKSAVVECLDLDISEETDEVHGEYDQDHKEHICQEFDSFRERYTEHLNKHSNDREKNYLKLLEENFKNIYENDPRIIAKYTCGIQGNKTLQGEEFLVDGVTEMFFIDAGIAKLEDSEMDKLVKNGTVRLGGNSKADLGQCRPLKVKEIDDAGNVHKCGRTTSNTKGFLLSRAVYLDNPGAQYQNIRCGCNRPTQSSFHLAFPKYYCKKCAREENNPNTTDGSNPNAAESELLDCFECQKKAMCLPYFALRHNYCQ